MADIYKTLEQSVEKWADMVKRKDTRGLWEGWNELKKYIGK